MTCFFGASPHLLCSSCCPSPWVQPLSRLLFPSLAFPGFFPRCFPELTLTPQVSAWTGLLAGGSPPPGAAEVPFLWAVEPQGCVVGVTGSPGAGCSSEYFACIHSSHTVERSGSPDAEPEMGISDAWGVQGVLLGAYGGVQAGREMRIPSQRWSH